MSIQIDLAPFHCCCFAVFVAEVVAVAVFGYFAGFGIEGRRIHSCFAVVEYFCSYFAVEQRFYSCFAAVAVVVAADVVALLRDYHYSSAVTAVARTYY